MTKHLPGEPTPDRGFILILAIWMAALLAVMAAAFSATVQSHLRLTAAAVSGAQAEALADAGVEIAVLSLIARSGRFPINGLPVSCAFEGSGMVTLRVQDAGGRISLNLAPERLFQALFIGLGNSREAASRFTDVILDYRDADSDRRPNGAERPEYIAAGRAAGPKNAPFDTVEELNQVLGLDPAMIALAIPHVTVHSETAGLDPAATSSGLAALLVLGQQQLPARSTPLIAAASPVPAEFVISSPRRTYFVTSQMRLATGAIFVREAVVELQSTRRPVYKMWRRGTRTDAPDQAAPPPC